MRKRLDMRAAFDGDAAPEKHVRFDDDVVRDQRVGGEMNAIGVDQGHTRIHKFLSGTVLENGFRLRQFAARIDPEHLIRIALDRKRRVARRTRKRHNIGQVVFLLCVIVFHLRKQLPRDASTNRHHARIA